MLSFFCREKLEEEQEFEVIGDVSELRQSASSDATSAEVTSSEVATSAEIASSSNGSGRPDTTLGEGIAKVVSHASRPEPRNLFFSYRLLIYVAVIFAKYQVKIQL